METVLGVLILNSSAIWALLCQTEAVLSRALLLTFYKHFSGINDKFFSNFICMVNMAFSFRSQGILFFMQILGSDELLTGITNESSEKPGISRFYVVTLGLIFVVFCGSSLIIIGKKVATFRKGKIFVESFKKRFW